jgi:antitoxin HicB
MKYELRENQEKTFSGKLNIRIPKTLHARLTKEAVDEGTSLNQLILAKLSRPL